MEKASPPAAAARKIFSIGSRHYKVTVVFFAAYDIIIKLAVDNHTPIRYKWRFIMSQSQITDNQDVQATMLIPLYGRAKAGERYPDLIIDREAIRIVSELDYDFSHIEETMNEMLEASYIIRAYNIDKTILRFIKKYPEGTIVNIGSGLDTTFSRIDNGRILWYNLDLPDAIEFRQRFIKPSGRCVDIAKSMLDYSWFHDVTVRENQSILLIAGGVFMYFDEPTIKGLINALIGHFKTGEVFFDANSKQGLKMSNRLVKKSGNNGAVMNFYVNNEKALMNWSPAIKKVSAHNYFVGIPKNKQWRMGTRFIMLFNNIFGMSKFVDASWS